MAYYGDITPQPLANHQDPEEHEPLANHQDPEEHERIYQQLVMKTIRNFAALNNPPFRDLDEYERQARVAYDNLFRESSRERIYEIIFSPVMSKESPEPMTRHLPMPTSCYLSPLEQDVKPPAMQVQSTLPKQYPGHPKPLSFATPRMPPPLPPLPKHLACSAFAKPPTLPKPPGFPTFPQPPGFPTLPQPPACSTLAKPPVFSSSMLLSDHQSG